MSTATMPEAQRDTLTLKDIAGFFQVSTETARKITRLPGFPRFQYERTIRVPRDQFVRWLEAQTGVRSRAHD